MFHGIRRSPPDADKQALLFIVSQYIGPYPVGDRGAITDGAEFYILVRTLAERRQISDGPNHRPLSSMRTLARTLTLPATRIWRCRIGVLDSRSALREEI